MFEKTLFKGKKWKGITTILISTSTCNFFYDNMKHKSLLGVMILIYCVLKSMGPKSVLICTLHNPIEVPSCKAIANINTSPMGVTPMACLGRVGQVHSFSEEWQKHQKAECISKTQLMLLHFDAQYCTQGYLTAIWNFLHFVHIFKIVNWKIFYPLEH